MLRLLITGPTDFDEIDFMEKELNKLTFQYDHITLISCQRPGKDHLAMFPQAEKWFTKRFLKGWKGYKTNTRFYPLYSGKKMFDEGMKRMRMEMIQNTDAVVAFWDVGGNDFHTEELVRLAKLFDLKLKVFRV